MNIVYSIIVPTHNSSSFIWRLLDSIPNRKDIELIIVDDHSSDYSILQNLINNQQQRYDMRLLKNPGKNSAGAARNIGLAAAEGRWILFADSDDTFTNDTEQILEYYRDSEASIVLFPPKATSSLPNTSSSRTSFMDFLFKSYHEGKISDKELLVRLTPIWSKLYKYEAIKGITFNETRVANDVAFAARSALATINNIVVDDTPIYTVTERKGSLTQSKRRRIDRLAQRTAERIKSDIWLKAHLLQSGHGNVRLARHHSIFRKIFATRNQ